MKVEWTRRAAALRALPLERAIEALAALCGITGALLLAHAGPHAGWGFAAFLASNAGWLAFSWRRHWFLFAQQIAFTGTSLYGIWVWLLRGQLS